MRFGRPWPASCRRPSSWAASSTTCCFSPDRSPARSWSGVGSRLAGGHRRRTHRRPEPAQAGGVRIRPSQPEEPVVVLGDPDRLRQAILIALDNAIRLAPEGTTVDLEVWSSSGDRVSSASATGPRDSPARNSAAPSPAFTARARRDRDRVVVLALACPSPSGSSNSMTARYASTARPTGAPRSKSPFPAGKGGCMTRRAC
jgi:hypothetical protein